jgi:hypothetical protein
VIGVEMADHQQRHVPYAEPAQASVDGGRFRTGVDHDGLARPDRKNRGVALAHVARDDQPTRGRPAGRGDPDRQGADHGGGRDDGGEAAHGRAAGGHQQRDQYRRQ